MQAWVPQPKYAQLLQVTLMMKIKWELLLPPLTWAVQKPSRWGVDASLHKATRESHIVSCCMWHFVTFSGDCMLLFNVMPMGLGDDRDNKATKVHRVHNTTTLLQTKEHAVLLKTKMSTNIWHAGLSVDSFLTSPEGLASVLFLLTSSFRKQNHFFLFVHIAWMCSCACCLNLQMLYL